MTSTIRQPPVTGKDALFLLTSMIRECDPLWSDCYECDILCDLHKFLQQDYKAYSTLCALPGVPDPVAEIVVPKGSVSSLWKLMKTPSDAGTSSTDKSSVIVESNSDTFGLFSHIIGYFLIGIEQVINDPSTVTTNGKPSSATAAPAKPIKALSTESASSIAVANTSAQNNSGPSVEPVLERVVLFRHELLNIEMKLREISSKIKDFTFKKWKDALKQNIEEFGTLICYIFNLIRKK
jgi:hypothetical protein